MSTLNLCFEQKYEKYQSSLSENFQFLQAKLSIYLNRRVFVMELIALLGLCTVCHGLLVLPFGVIGRLWSVIVAIMHLFANITGNQASRLQLGTSFQINTILDRIAADPRCLKGNNSIHLFSQGWPRNSLICFMSWLVLGKHARFDSDFCYPHYYIYVVVGYKQPCICLMLNKYIVLYCIVLLDFFYRGFVLLNL